MSFKLYLIYLHVFTIYLVFTSLKTFENGHYSDLPNRRVHVLFDKFFPPPPGCHLNSGRKLHNRCRITVHWWHYIIGIWKNMRFEKSPQRIGAWMTRAWHYHGSDTPTSPMAIFVLKSANANNVMPSLIMFFFFEKSIFFILRIKAWRFSLSVAQLKTWAHFFLL